MAIPNFEEIMLPLLRFASDRLEHFSQDAIKILAKDFRLTPQEKEKMLPTGKQSVFFNSYHFALTELCRWKLVERTQLGYFRITELGVLELKENMTKLTRTYLKNKYGGGKDASKIESDLVDTPKPPLQILQASYEEIKEELASELLVELKRVPSGFFEKIVNDLLSRMGYGGMLLNSSTVTGRPGDEGIDGVIKQDRLGLDIICFQTKRWEYPIPQKEIRDFAGALEHKHTDKGIFVTTSSFSKDAAEYVKKISKKIILIDGKQLTELMVEYDVGVSVEETYKVKKVDSDYFDYNDI